MIAIIHVDPQAPTRSYCRMMTGALNESSQVPPSPHDSKRVRWAAEGRIWITLGDQFLDLFQKDGNS